MRKVQDKGPKSRDVNLDQEVVERCVEATLPFELCQTE